MQIGGPVPYPSTIHAHSVLARIKTAGRLMCTRTPNPCNFAASAAIRSTLVTTVFLQSKTFPTMLKNFRLMFVASSFSAPTIHSHHRWGRKTRGHKHQAEVFQHCRESFRLEENSRHQRRANGITCCKIAGVWSAGTHQPPPRSLSLPTQNGRHNKHGERKSVSSIARL